MQVIGRYVHDGDDDGNELQKNGYLEAQCEAQCEVTRFCILLFQATSSKASVNTLPRACRD